MLVLQRFEGESIVITVPPSDKAIEIEVAVVDIRHESVRIGTEAPKEVAVHRKEVAERIRKEGRRSP